jgi:hypothetical protein
MGQAAQGEGMGYVFIIAFDKFNQLMKPLCKARLLRSERFGNRRFKFRAQCKKAWAL